MACALAAMHHIFQRFVERLNESTDPTGFRSTMAEAAEALDLPCFAYARVPADAKGVVDLISTYPVGWTDHYLKSHYETLDPVIRTSHESIEPFEWGQEVGGFELTDRQKDFFDEASHFGIRCGFTIPMRDGSGPIAAVTFASNSPREAFIRSIRANARALQLMAISLHAHARRQLWRPANIIGGVQLSPREMECLIWASQGKSAWATGKILGISDATVKFHLANVRSKLKVTNLRQAIALLNRTQTR